MHPHDSTLPGRVELTCQYCGKVFTTFRSRNAQFCSFECGVANREIPIETRFWEKVQKSDDCWLWTGSLNEAGYGTFPAKINGKWRPILAHRLSYELVYGVIPDGMQACHHCDNPACVRHDHLFLGSNDDNIADKMSKGRQMKGVKVPASKMTEAQIIEIRQRYAAGGISKTELASEYGIGKPAMGDILNGVTWKHLPTFPMTGKRGVGRRVRGEQMYYAKLTDNHVVEIRQRYATGTIQQKQLAQEYGVSDSVISEVVHRKIWKHVP